MDKSQTYHLDTPALSDHITTLVEQSFQKLGDNLADSLALLQVEMLEGEQDCNVRTAYMAIKDQIAENLDGILLRNSLAMAEEIKRDLYI